MPAMSARVLLGAAFVSCLIVASAESTSQSGVAGTLTVSPSCPGPQLLDEKCESALVGIQVRLVNRNGIVVGMAKTSAKGEFSIVAPQGSYLLEPVIQGRLPRCPSVSVDIVGGKNSTVRISCDSGMR